MFKGLNKRIKIVLLTQSAYSFVTQFLIQYNALFAQSLGASGTDIGLIILMSAFILFIGSPYIGLAIERYSMKKMMLLGLICDLISMLFFITANVWYLLIPALAIYFSLFRQIAFADIIFITFIEPNKRATLMSFSRILWSIMAIFAPPIAASIVTYFGGINAHGIRPLYHISFVILLAIILILYMGMDEFFISSNPERNKATHEMLNEYRRILEAESHLKYWLIIRFFRGGSISLLTTFAPLWVVNVKGGTAIILGTLLAISTICGLLMQFPAGWLADKIGRKKTFILFSIFYCLGLIILAFAPSYEYLVLASVFGIGIGGIEGGGMGGAANIPLMAMWWEAVPSTSRGRLYGLEGMIIATSKIFAFIGGILWDWGLKILTILIPVLVEVLVIIPLLLSQIPETLQRLRRDVNIF